VWAIAPPRGCGAETAKSVVLPAITGQKRDPPPHSLQTRHIREMAM
jgi:hypothetical protein